MNLIVFRRSVGKQKSKLELRKASWTCFSSTTPPPITKSRRTSICSWRWFQLVCFSTRLLTTICRNMFKRWSKTDEFMTAVVKRAVSKPWFIRILPGFIKLHVGWTMDLCCLAQLYSKKRKASKTGIPLHPSRLYSDALEKFENMLRRKTSKHWMSKHKTFLLGRVPLS